MSDQEMPEKIGQESAGNVSDHDGGDEFRDHAARLDRAERDPGPYSAAVAGYLDGADWLDEILDAPLIVHARSIAASLDRQMESKGEIQSALAGSFDKALFRLDARRPKAPGGHGGGPASDPHQSSVFDFLSD